MVQLCSLVIAPSLPTKQAEKILGTKIGQLSSGKVRQVGYKHVRTFPDTLLLATVDGCHDQKTLKLADCVGQYSRSHIWNHNRSCCFVANILSATSSYQFAIVCGTKKTNQKATYNT